MTPEDIEQLKQLKALKDDGVITEAEFETQKQLVLNPDFVESDLKSTSALEPESEKLHAPSEEPRPNIFVGSGGGGSPTSVEKLEGDNRPLKVFTAIFAIAALVAIGVVVFGGSDDSRPSAPVSSPVTTEIPITEAPEEADLVDEGQVWEWYSLMVLCANDTTATLQQGEDGLTRSVLVETVQPSLSYYAGVLLRVAELVESTDWSKAKSSNQSELEAVMTEMAQLLREQQQVNSLASRTSPEAWNEMAPLLRGVNFTERFRALDDSIYDLIGGGFPPEITESVGDGGSWCDYLSRYEENPPDFSYFRTEKNFTDEFWDYDLRKVCGMLRDLQVPNGNNPEANINYLSAQAQRLYEKIQNDELYDLDQSRFYYLGIDLVVTMEVFAERSEQYMPMSHLSAVGNCENLGW
jgi:hypothetical protein